MLSDLLDRELPMEDKKVIVLGPRTEQRSFIKHLKRALVSPKSIMALLVRANDIPPN